MKTQNRWLSITVLLLLSIGAKAQPARKPVPAPAPPPAAAVEQKKADTVDSSLLLDFSQFNWKENTKGKTETPKTETTKTKTDTGTGSLLLDFSNFNWGHNAAKSSGSAKSLTIGTQTWSTDNLNVATFKNGDIIPEAKTENEWIVAGVDKKPVWCYYNNDPVNGAKYGRLYNYYATADPRGLAPAGWHIPTEAEWNTLITYAKTAGITDDKLKSRTTSGYGFAAGGFRYNNHGAYTFDDIEKNGHWWSATRKTMYGAWGSSVNTGAGSFSLYTGFEGMRSSSDSRVEGLSVRCIKD